MQARKGRRWVPKLMPSDVEFSGMVLELEELTPYKVFRQGEEEYGLGLDELFLGGLASPCRLTRRRRQLPVWFWRGTELTVVM